MKKSGKFVFGLIFTGVLILSFLNSSCMKKPPADLVLLNGAIFTVDADNPIARALVISGNKITKICTKDSEAEKYVGDETRVID